MSAREQIETRWGLILVIFMRLLAALWILQGPQRMGLVHDAFAARSSIICRKARRQR